MYTCLPNHSSIFIFMLTALLKQYLRFVTKYTDTLTFNFALKIYCKFFVEHNANLRKLPFINSIFIDYNTRQFKRYVIYMVSHKLSQMNKNIPAPLSYFIVLNETTTTSGITYLSLLTHSQCFILLDNVYFKILVSKTFKQNSYIL